MRPPGCLTGAVHAAISLRLTEEAILVSDISVITRRQRAVGGPSQTKRPKPETKPRGTCETQVEAIAASRGGPPALRQILRALPASFPIPVLIVRHIASGFGQDLVR